MKKNIKDHALEDISDDQALTLEDTLWWLQGRKEIIRSYLKTANATSRISRVMDIGCGSGGNFDVLAEFGKVVGVDRSPVLVMRARRRGTAESVHEGEVFDLQSQGQVDLFSLFDVLEHMEDDAGFIARLKHTSPENHMLLLSVPACQCLYSDHDRLLHHYRRYSRERLEALLKDSGYQTIRSSYFMFFLFPFAILSRMTEKFMRLLGRKKTRVSMGGVPNWLGHIFARTLHAEARLSERLPFPIGLWLFVLAKPRGPISEA